MKLIVLRHGETEEEKKGVILGILPGTLSTEGRKQAKKTAAIISSAGLGPEIILTSDLARAADYAALIGDELGLKVIPETLVRERNAGKESGKTEKEVNWEEYEKIDRQLRKHAGGENLEEVHNRAKEFLEKLGSLPYHTAIVVSHSVFLAMLIMEICDWPLERALSYNFRQILVVDTKKKRVELLPPSLDDL